jgi:glycosyltransferase involved in cell wall biosynthesis
MSTDANSIALAIAAAKRGDLATADKLLHAVEARIAGEAAAAGRTSTLDLVNHIRKSYGIAQHAAPAALVLVTTLTEHIESGVSLVTCCMNRTENLLKALPTWLAHPEIREIIIVDWSSRTPVTESLRDAGMNDPRIRIVRAVDEPRWILSYAFNLGFRCTRYDRILKVDADITLKPSFFQKNTLKHGIFIAGNWEFAEKGQEHVNGFFYLHRDDLLNIKGFNEYITTYGWDDDDIYARLSKFGLKRTCVDMTSIYHIPHDDAQRLGHSGEGPVHAFDELHADPAFKIRANRWLAMVMPPWQFDRSFAPFEILRDDGAYLEMRRKKHAMPHYVSDDIARDAECYAALELVSWRIGPQVYHLPRADFVHLLESRSLGEISAADVSRLLETPTKPRGDEATSRPLAAPKIGSSRRRFFIDAQHGLGNRLRAMASGAAIAAETGRELVVVWQPDHHCDCRIFDLFDFRGAVVEESFVETARSDGLTVFNYMEVEEGAAKDHPIALDPAKDCYVRSAYALNSPQTNWDSENRWLQGLPLVAAVRDLVAGVGGPYDVSAHVRMEAGAGLDHNTYDSPDNWTADGHRLLHEWRAKSHFSHFMRRIDTLTSQGKAHRLFLAADRAEIYDEFIRRYDDRIVYLKRDLYDRSREQIQYALADAILLSRAPLLLGSTWSSFSELAMRLAQQKLTVEMSGKDF